jgi:hypothetical protein
MRELFLYSTKYTRIIAIPQLEVNLTLDYSAKITLIYELVQLLESVQLQ